MSTMREDPKNSEPQRGYSELATALFFSLMGLFLLLASLDIIPEPEKVSRHEAVFDTVHHWQITTFGLMFFSAGASVAIPARFVGMRKLAGIVSALAFLIGFIGVLAFVRSR